SEVGEAGRDYLRAPVVAVLPHLGDEYPRPSARLLRELVRHLARLAEFPVLRHFAGVDARDRAYDGAVTPEDLLAGVGYLAEGGALARGVHRELKEIPVARFGALRYRFEGEPDSLPVALLLQLLQPF